VLQTKDDKEKEIINEVKDVAHRGKAPNVNDREEKEQIEGR
jgi:hypothetical protein